MKIEAFHKIKDFLKDKAFKDKTYPPVMEEMMTYVSKMDFDEEPNYKHFRDLFRYVKTPKSSQNGKKEPKIPDFVKTITKKC